MTCNKDCSAVTGDKTSGINANTVSERNIIVTEKKICVNIAVIDYKLTEQISVVRVLNGVVFNISFLQTVCILFFKGRKGLVLLHGPKNIIVLC